MRTRMLLNGIKQTTNRMDEQRTRWGGSGKGAGCDKMCAYTGLLLFRFKTISTDVVVNFAMASSNDESDEGFSCISIIERQELCRCDKDPPTLTHWIGLMKHFLRFQRLRRIWSYLGSHLKDRKAIGRGQIRNIPVE